MRPRSRSAWVATGLVTGLAAALGALGSPSAYAVGDGLSDWDPPQVIDAQEGVGEPSAFFDTVRGRAVVVHAVDLGAPWASSRAAGSAAWKEPKQLASDPDQGSGNPMQAGPVAVGPGGGAAVFLQSVYGYLAYVSMTPDGRWTKARPFPYQPVFTPKVALVRPRAGIVAIGTRKHHRVRAAVKPEGGHWHLSPGLALDDAAVSGAWYDAEGRVHVLVCQRPQSDGGQGLYEAVLRTRDGEPTWGPLRLVPTGSAGGSLGSASEVSVVSNARGEITVQWQQRDAAGDPHQAVRHRDASGEWTPIRELPTDDRVVLGGMGPDGSARLSYLSEGAPVGDYQLLTRILAADGTLGDEVVVDSFTDPGFRLGAAPGSGLDLLLGWTTYDEQTSDQENHVYRCLSRGCGEVGSWNGPAAFLLTLTPQGDSFIAGVGDGIPGCPSDALCSRRLPTEEGTS